MSIACGHPQGRVGPVHVEACVQEEGGQNPDFFCGRHKWMAPNFTCFASPSFDHDAFMHHAIRVLDVSVYDRCDHKIVRIIQDRYTHILVDIDHYMITNDRHDHV